MDLDACSVRAVLVSLFLNDPAKLFPFAGNVSVSVFILLCDVRAVRSASNEPIVLRSLQARFPEFLTRVDEVT